MSTGSSDLTEANLRAFPKVELHRHLEGTFSVPALHRMAMRNGLAYPDDLASFRKLVQFPKDSEPDFLKFLSLFKNDWYRSMEDIADITTESVREFAADGLFYIELRFSPEHFAFHNNFDRAEVTRTVVAAAESAAAESGIEIRFLITLNRSKQDENEMLVLYELVRDLGLTQIVGIDLAGDETNFPPELFANLFARIKADGVYSSTIHAGEVSPAPQIWDSINLLHADRIGHGVSAIEDTELQRLLTDNNIVLEQCITSNYQTGAWTDEERHPMGSLHDRGVPVTINSDDPFIQDSDLTEDYIKAVRNFGFTLDDLVTLNLRALDAAFVSSAEDLKTRYRSRVNRFRSDAGL